MIRRTFGSLLTAMIVMSCASSYKPIMPKMRAFTNPQTSEGITYAYRTNVLTETGNKKYANKEAKHGVKLIAIEIENQTESDIVLRNDAKFYLGDRIVFPMEPQQIHQQIKQPAGLYMLWSLLWIVINKCEGDDCTSIPLPVGVVIGAANTGLASSANKRLLEELMVNNILDRKISPGEKAIGLIGITADDIQSLRVELAR